MPSEPEYLHRFAKENRRKMTPPERAMWNSLRRYRSDGLVFRNQEPIDAKYIVDFVCYSAKVVIEIDGFWSHFDRGENDLKRKGELEAEGFLVLSFTAKDVMERRHEIVEGIVDVCRSRIGAPSPSASQVPLPSRERES